MQRSLVFLLTAALGASACASDETDNLGQVDVSLVGQAPSGTTYRLRAAVLTIDGPGGPRVFHTEDDPDRAQINARLQSGAYTLSLAPGWHLERVVTGGGQPVEATLLSAHPLGFQVIAGEFTPVALRFRAGADDVGLGEGDVGISIGVEEGQQEIVASPTSADVIEGNTLVVNVHLAQSITAPVVVTTLALGNIEVPQSSLTFTPANYQVDQAVVIHTVQDVNIEDTTGALRLSSPGLADRTINVQVHDDDVLDIQTTTGSISTSEGGFMIFGVRLDAPPLAPVTIDVVSVGGGWTTTVPAPLIFTPDDWNTFKSVHVTSVQDDDVVDATGLLSLVAPGIATVTLPVTIFDDDVQAILTSHTAVTLPEGTAQGIQLRLAFAPAGGVAVAVTSNNAAVASASPGELVFTPTNWNLPQTVTLAGIAPGTAVIQASTLGATTTIPVVVEDVIVTQTLGWPIPSATTSPIPGNELQLYPIDLASPASLDRLQIFGTGVGAPLRFAVYRDGGNQPGPLVFGGSPIPPAPAGQPTVQPVSGVVLQPGRYWIGVVTSFQSTFFAPVPAPPVQRCRLTMSFSGAFPQGATAFCTSSQPLSIAALVLQ